MHFTCEILERTSMYVVTQKTWIPKKVLQIPTFAPLLCGSEKLGTKFNFSLHKIF
jgi:hypothetical protein